MEYMSKFDAGGVSPEALSALAAFEAATGRAWKINSAYRSPEKNAQVGGAKKSQHMHGNAFDIDVSGLSEEDRVDLIRKARAAGFRGVGVYDNALHFDVGGERAWGADYTSKSIPGWATEAVANSLSGSGYAENTLSRQQAQPNALAQTGPVLDFSGHDPRAFMMPTQQPQPNAFAAFLRG